MFWVRNPGGGGGGGGGISSFVSPAFLSAQGSHKLCIGRTSTECEDCSTESELFLFTSQSDWFDKSLSFAVSAHTAGLSHTTSSRSVPGFDLNWVSHTLLAPLLPGVTPAWPLVTPSSPWKMSQPESGAACLSSGSPILTIGLIFDLRGAEKASSPALGGATRLTLHRWGAVILSGLSLSTQYSMSDTGTLGFSELWLYGETSLVFSYWMIVWRVSSSRGALSNSNVSHGISFVNNLVGRFSHESCNFLSHALAAWLLLSVSSLREDANLKKGLIYDYFRQCGGGGSKNVVTWTFLGTFLTHFSRAKPASFKFIKHQKYFCSTYHKSILRIHKPS